MSDRDEVPMTVRKPLGPDALSMRTVRTFTDVAADTSKVGESGRGNKREREKLIHSGTTEP